ncbi:MAG: L-threonylcarbamoyladenylate synthase [bacterium]|nr:L-threonylcarbamoyladenylate synthase [candidate division KSB1 bacterium]MDH7561361.1 L-threonylcarbamoyladenylate synthase [bacterium]
MKRLLINPKNPQGRLIRRAAAVLADGGVVCYPTDTVYGIGCGIFHKKASERIYRLKGKGHRDPLSFICPSLQGIAQYAHVSDHAYRIMRRLLPGPYTVVLPATRLVPKMMLSNRKTVGIRVPDNRICMMLLEEFGKPIVSTSASLPGREILHDPDEIAEALAPHIDLFLDCGPLGLEPSTVVDLTGEEPVIVRQGKGPIDLLV